MEGGAGLPDKHQEADDAWPPAEPPHHGSRGDAQCALLSVPGQASYTER